MRRVIPSAIMIGSVLLASAGNTNPGQMVSEEPEVTISVLDNIISIEDSYVNREWNRVADSLPMNSTRYTELTEADFRKVADELGVELAAIKAVVEIEAGHSMQGFWAPGIPVINFDQKMCTRMCAKTTSKAGAKGEKVPKGLSGYALREWTQLINARKKNAQGANLGTFWGMFQIGGFNYRQCGCESVDEFVKLMSYSELEQLELFAAFITNSGMLDDLKKKNWAAFARKYNGAGYKKRGYDTKMAAAYKKYKAAK
ncbi:MAG: N-acetylmuramidase family protein [Bacteroides sp.]|nr:N-acetylmuramidase family protein [Bacteroides sp.]